jgi:hypothetical protein
MRGIDCAHSRSLKTLPDLVNRGVCIEEVVVVIEVVVEEILCSITWNQLSKSGLVL